MLGLNGAQMNALISSQTMMKSMTNLGALRTSVNGNMGVLRAQIESDAALGADTTAKEERLALMQQNANSIEEKLGGMAAGISETLAEAGEKAQKEETAKSAAAEKAKQAAENGAAKTTQAPGGAAPASPGAGDTVDFSVYAQNMAASQPLPLPEAAAPQPAPGPTAGAVLDISV